MTASIRGRAAVKFSCPKCQTGYCAETENFPWVFTCIMCGEMAKVEPPEAPPVTKERK